MGEPRPSTTEQYLRRRRVPRRKVNRRIGLLIRGVYSISRVHQVGEGGMLISAPVPLEKGQQVVITYSLPGLRTVMRATVRYISRPNEECSEVRYGVQFENVDFDAKRKIRNFVASATSEAETADD